MKPWTLGECELHAMFEGTVGLLADTASGSPANDEQVFVIKTSSVR